MAGTGLPPPQPNNMTWRLQNLEDRLKSLEAVSIHAKLAVLEERLNTMNSDAKALRRGFYGFAFSMVGGVVVLAAGLVTQL